MLVGGLEGGEAIIIYCGALEEIELCVVIRAREDSTCKCKELERQLLIELSERLGTPADAEHPDPAYPTPFNLTHHLFQFEHSPTGIGSHTLTVAGREGEAITGGGKHGQFDKYLFYAAVVVVLWGELLLLSLGAGFGFLVSPPLIPDLW